MNNMKLIMETWRKFLLETANKDFMEEFMPIYKKWHDLQDQYGVIHRGPWTDPEGETHFPKDVQSVPIEDQPEYVRDAPKFYQANVDHPATRRATFSQTDAEVQIEKELLRLFQKYADQNFFKNDVIKHHDFSYRAAVQKPWSQGELKFRDFARDAYLDMEGQRGKDVMSCHGSVDKKLRGNYGMILQGHTVFASRDDLASQTLRVAHEKVRQKHVGSGLPKRASPRKVHPSEEEIERRLKWHERKRQMYIRRGREDEAEPPMTREQYIEQANSVVLNSQDVGRSGEIEEILIDNWTIEGWYFMESLGARSTEPPQPEAFWRKAWEKGIQKPVYRVSSMGGNMVQVDLNDFFGEKEAEEVSSEEDID